MAGWVISQQGAQASSNDCACLPLTATVTSWHRMGSAVQAQAQGCLITAWAGQKIWAEPLLAYDLLALSGGGWSYHLKTIVARIFWG